MSNPRIKVADNIDQVAKDIISYIFSYHKTPEDRNKHFANLTKIITDVQTKYKIAQVNIIFIAWFERTFIHYFSRQRTNDLNNAVDSLKQVKSSDIMIIFETIIALLKQGECESTSLNTHLMNQLIQAVDKYEPIEDDKRLKSLGSNTYGSQMGVRVTLKDMLLLKGNSIIEDYKRKAAQKDKAESSTLNLAKAIKDNYIPSTLDLSKFSQLEKKIAKKYHELDSLPKPLIPVARTEGRIFNQYADSIKALNSLFATKVEKEKNTNNTKLTMKVGKINK